jgi:HPt (histidine-containing phosphotransfer) domain-containing protein
MIFSNAILLDGCVEQVELPDRLPGLDVKGGVARMGGGGREGYLRLLAKFSNNSARVVADIDERLARGDEAAAQRLAHTLAGVAGNVGADALHRAAGGLETALKEGRRAAYGECLKEVEARFVEARASMESLIRRDPTAAEDSGADEAPDIESAVSLLRELKTSLEGYNAKSMSIFISLTKILRGARWSAKLAPLEKRLDAYDFDGALGELTRIMSELEG